jgi:hypothetical protein
MSKKKKTTKEMKKDWESTLKTIFPPDQIFLEQEGNDEQYKPIKVGIIEGKLITKKTAVGSMSEGVKYFIIPSDQYHNRWKEVLIRKKTRLWQNDPQLHPYRNKYVEIKGDIIETRSSITVDCIEIKETV